MRYPTKKQSFFLAFLSGTSNFFGPSYFEMALYIVRGSITKYRWVLTQKSMVRGLRGVLLAFYRAKFSWFIRRMVIHPVTVYRFDIKLNYNCTGALLNQLTEMFVIGCSLPNKLIQKFYYACNYDAHHQD